MLCRVSHSLSLWLWLSLSLTLSLVVGIAQVLAVVVALLSVLRLA